MIPTSLKGRFIEKRNMLGDQLQHKPFLYFLTTSKLFRSLISDYNTNIYGYKKCNTKYVLGRI